jgi:tetratricopeptide (TPR) repeat protein
MKKLNQLAVLALAAIMVPLASSPAQAQDSNGTQAQPAQPGAQPQQKKEIKDPAEYNAYVAALGMSNPAQKAAAMEQFLQQYPNTVMKSEALEQVMGAYQQAGDVQKAMDAATRLVQADPNNVAALYLLAVVNRTNAQNGNAQAAPAARQNGEKGLQALQSFAKPDGMTPDAYDKAKQQMALGFNGAAGFGALQAGDYPNAQKYLGAAVNANPTDLSNVYPLALAYLQPKPLNPLGFWYGARAINLSKSNAAANAQITKYVQNKYENYHGGTDGWDQILAAAAASPNPPANFSVVQETPATHAAKIAQSGDPKTMDFGSWQIVLTDADPPVADNFWSQIKGVPQAFQAKVIEADKDKLLVAATVDAMTENKADTEITMAAPIPVKLIPKVGETIGVQGVTVSYDKNPYMLHMDQGKLVVAKKKPAAPVHHRAHPAAR